MVVAHPGSWDVEIVLRCSTRNARIARAAAAASAVLEDFSIEQVEDVRLLVDEVFVLLCQAGADTAHMRLAMGDGCLAIEMCGDGSPPDVELDVGVLETLVGVIAPGATVALDATPPRFMALVRHEPAP
jgi:hypothetical protein